MLLKNLKKTWTSLLKSDKKATKKLHEIEVTTSIVIHKPNYFHDREVEISKIKINQIKPLLDHLKEMNENRYKIEKDFRTVLNSFKPTIPILT